MGNKTDGGCRERDAILEASLSPENGASLSDDLKRHLEECASCRACRNAADAVKIGFAESELYSPALRERTLRRMSGANHVSAVRWLPLIVPGALLSLFLSLLVPGWLLGRLFLHWTASAAAAYGAGCAILMILGTMITAVAGISLMEGGYLQEDHGARCRT